MNNIYGWALRLIDECYAAATNDDLWSDFLQDFRQFVDGHGATLFFTDDQLRPIDKFFHSNISPESISDYQAHFHTVDIRMQRTVSGGLNRIITDLDLVDETVISSHEFYQDFLRPIGHRYIVAAALDLNDGGYAFCSSHRGLNQDHADSDILDRAQLIIPHIRRSLQLRRRLSTADVDDKAAYQVLDRLGQGVFLIGSQGRILWQNSWASALLAQEDGLITADGELRALSTNASAELQKLIKSAIAVLKRPRARAGGLMIIPRPSLKRAYQVLVTPLATAPEISFASQQIGISPAAAVFVMDLEQKPLPRTEILRKLYNLTPAEARLATALGSGLSIKSYAERAKLSVHYVRWLLKQVEAKTDTRRMTDLILLLARQTEFFGTLIDNIKGKDR